MDIDATFPKDFHVTLAFLGELYDDQVEKTRKKLEALSLKPAEVLVDGAGFFPNENFVRVFWVGVEGLGDLQARVGNALDYDEKFSGHVTLARIKSPKNLQQLRELAKACAGKEFGRTRVDEIVLFKSTLSPGGPVYEELMVKKLS